MNIVNISSLTPEEAFRLDGGLSPEHCEALLDRLRTLDRVDELLEVVSNIYDALEEAKRYTPCASLEMHIDRAYAIVEEMQA